MCQIVFQSLYHVINTDPQCFQMVSLRLFSYLNFMFLLCQELLLFGVSYHPFADE